MTVNFHTPSGDQDAGREGRPLTLWVCSECGESVPSHYGPPMMPARGHYHDDPEQPFGKRIFHPAEEIEVAPVSELERVEAERDRAEKFGAAVESKWGKQLRRADDVQSLYEALRGEVEELQGWVKERADEADRLYDQAVARDPHSHACAHSAGLLGAYGRTAKKFPALLDQKGEGGTHDGYELTPEECREIFALCLAHGMRPPEIHPTHPLVTGVDKLGLSQPHPEDGDPGRAVRLPAQPKDKGACETCGGSEEVPSWTDGFFHTEQQYEPCPDCTTGKQVEAERWFEIRWKDRFTRITAPDLAAALHYAEQSSKVVSVKEVANGGGDPLPTQPTEQAEVGIDAGCLRSRTGVRQPASVDSSLNEAERFKRLRDELLGEGAARVICANVSGLSPEAPEDVTDVRRALATLWDAATGHAPFDLPADSSLNQGGGDAHAAPAGNEQNGPHVTKAAVDVGGGLDRSHLRDANETVRLIDDVLDLALNPSPPKEPRTYLREIRKLIDFTAAPQSSHVEAARDGKREYRVNAYDGIYGPFSDAQAALSELGEHQADYDDNGGPRPPELESRAIGPWEEGRFGRSTQQIDIQGLVEELEKEYARADRLARLYQGTVSHSGYAALRDTLAGALFRLRRLSGSGGQG